MSFVSRWNPCGPLLFFLLSICAGPFPRPRLAISRYLRICTHKNMLSILSNGGRTLSFCLFARTQFKILSSRPPTDGNSSKGLLSHADLEPWICAKRSYTFFYIWPFNRVCLESFMVMLVGPESK